MTEKTKRFRRIEDLFGKESAAYVAKVSLQPENLTETHLENAGMPINEHQSGPWLYKIRIWREKEEYPKKKTYLVVALKGRNLEERDITNIAVSFPLNFEQNAVWVSNAAICLTEAYKKRKRNYGFPS